MVNAAGDANVVVPTETEQGLTWPTPRASGTRLNTGVGIINTLAWISSSNYHAMNLQVSRTRARQRVGLAYTWSKSIDTSSSTIASDYNNSIQSPLLFFPEALRGLSDFDKRHNLVINYLWQVPGSGSNGAIARLLTNGWQIGGISAPRPGCRFRP